MKLYRRFLSTLAFILIWGATMPAFAAQQLRLRLGPFETSVTVSDLERFAKTGELSGNLRPFSLVLTSEVRQALSQRLRLDPRMVDRWLNEWLSSPAAAQLLRTLRSAVPNISIEQVKATIAIAARQANGLTPIGILRAFPQETVTVDVTNAIALVLQFNPSYWTSQALSPLLERELAVSGDFSPPDFNPAASGNERVRQRTLTLRDRDRDRILPVDVYWSYNTQSPLVVMSHGFGADRKFLAYLAAHLASHGFTVVALDHPGSNVNFLSRASFSGKPSDLIPPTEFIDRPKDISFVLDELARIDREPGSLSGKFNTRQVTIIGHSLGGYTALALAGAELKLDRLRQVCQSPNVLKQSPAEWLQCAAADLPQDEVQLRDERVASAIVLNPVIGQLFGKDGLKNIPTPILIAAATEDAFTPAANHQLQPFTQLQTAKYLLTAIGGTHLSIGDPDNLGSQSTLVRELIGPDAEPLRRLIQGVSLAFIKQLTPEAQIYQPFLTPGYAQSLSTSELPLRLNTELPNSVSRWLDLANAIAN